MIPYRKIDWCAVINYLIDESGYTVDQICKQTGFSENTIRKMKAEMYDNENIDKPIHLMLMFLHKNDRDIPVVGKHYEEII